MSRLVSLFKLLSIILCKIWIVLWIHGHNGVTVAFDYGDNQDNHAHILSPDDNTTLSSSRSHHHHHHQHFHHEHSLKVNSTHDQKPKPKKPQFAVMTNWTFAPCQVDPALEKLVHNNGTRTLLLMYYHNAFSESVVRKYTRCHPWMIPVLVKRSVYMESSVYRDYFQHRMKHFLLKADYIITSTYKHVPVIDGDVKPENQTVGPITPLTLDFIHNLIKTAHENNYDVLPIERFPYVNIYDSLIPNHGVPSVAAWRNLLTRLGFSLDDLSYCRFIFPFWRLGCSPPCYCRNR